MHAATGRLRTVLAALGIMCGMALAVVGFVPGVSNAAPAPVTDFASYPPPFPAGCAAEGADVLTGVQFSAGGQTATDLRNLAIAPGDRVDMTWTGFAPGCESLGIGLSVKISKKTTFDINDDQYLHSFTYCGTEGPTCASPFALSVTLPASSVVPCWQLDAHIGPPLSIVGPSGRYYSFNNPHNMLISAQNGGSAPCDVPLCAGSAVVPAPAITCGTTPTTTTTTTTTAPTTSTTEPRCSTNPELPASSPDCQPAQRPTTTTTTAPTTTTTEPRCSTNADIPASSPNCQPSAESPTTTTTAPRCGTNPALAASSPSCTPCASGQQIDATTGLCVAVSSGSAARTIPVTGSETRPQLILAGVLLALGTPLVLLFRRRPGSRFSR